MLRGLSDSVLFPHIGVIFEKTMLSQVRVDSCINHVVVPDASKTGCHKTTREEKMIFSFIKAVNLLDLKVSYKLIDYKE